MSFDNRGRGKLEVERLIPHTYSIADSIPTMSIFFLVKFGQRQPPVFPTIAGMEIQGGRNKSSH